MRHAKRSKRLGVKTAHRMAMLRNLSKSLVEHGRIKTTTARAKALRSFLEPLVTQLKEPSVHNLRLVQSKLSDRVSVMTLAEEIAPRFKERPGGYLRILKLAKPRDGDQADMSLIEWVEESLVSAYNELREGKKSAVSKKKTSAAKKKSRSKASASAKKDSAPKAASESESAKLSSEESTEPVKKAKATKKTAKAAPKKKAAKKKD